MDDLLMNIWWKVAPERFRPPPVGVTPHSVLATFGRSRLLAYQATVPVRHAVPVLFIPSLVNRHYILDLIPERSVVKYLLDKGYDVYMLDWGTPGPEDAMTSMDDYIARRMHHAVRAVSARHQGRPVSLIGYCMGGTMSLAYAGFAPERVKNLVLLATPVDFTKVGLLTLWAQGQKMPLDSMVEGHRLIPPSILQAAFTMLQPTWVIKQAQGAFSLPTSLPTVKKGATPEERAKTEAMRAATVGFIRFYNALSRWVNDNVAVPGEAFRDWTRDHFQRNALMTNQLAIAGVTIRGEAIKASVLNVIASKDHIIPPDSSLALNGWLGEGRDMESRVLDLGHIGLSVGEGSFRQVWSGVASWLATRSDETVQN